MEIGSHASPALTFPVTSHKCKLLNLIYKALHELVSAYFHELMSCHSLPYPLCSEGHTGLSVLEFIKLICIKLLAQGHLQWISHLKKKKSFCFLSLADDLPGRSQHKCHLSERHFLTNKSKVSIRHLYVIVLS